LRTRKRKTPRQYTGNSLKTKYRHKKARLQLAEKGFIGVFEYLDLQKQAAAKNTRNGATSNLTQEPSAQKHPVPEEEEESSTEDDEMTAAAAMATSTSTTAAGVTCYESTTRIARLEHLQISGVRVLVS
jgi:hypothetical protein